MNMPQSLYCNITNYKWTFQIKKIQSIITDVQIQTQKQRPGGVYSYFPAEYQRVSKFIYVSK
jgi:hypothetical protein